MKLKIGTSSCHVRFLPQEKHFDLPFNVIPVLYRKETTFKKLPMIAPSTNEKIKKNIDI